MLALEKELELAKRRAHDTGNQLKENDKEIRKLRGYYDKVSKTANGGC